MGSALEVPLPEGLIKEATISVKISYSTTKDCQALQWLAKECFLSFSMSTESLTRSKDKPREKRSRMCSANVNQSTLVHWHPFKV